MNCVSAPPELAEVLSPSQVRCFMDCQARWWFKHGLRYPDSPTGKIALGRAVHAALAQNFAQKIESYEDLPICGSHRTVPPSLGRRARTDGVSR